MNDIVCKTVYQGGTGEIEEKKSRFIATVCPVACEEEAIAFFNRIKKEYWDARHNCTAFTIGEKHENTRCSDDGEPSGTAGRPMLDVLLREDIHNTAVVVTRYFGGTLLGTGGLVRAYQKSVQAGLANSVIIERRRGRALTIDTDYTGLGKSSTYLPRPISLFWTRNIPTRYASVRWFPSRSSPPCKTILPREPSDRHCKIPATR